MAEMSPEKRALLDQFGERVKAIRQEQKLTQQELADLMHAPRTWVSDLENAGQRGIAAETVVRFAKALGVSTDYLLGMSDDPHPRRRRSRPTDDSPYVPTALVLVRHQPGRQYPPAPAQCTRDPTQYSRNRGRPL